MNKILNRIIVLLFLILTGCNQENCAAELEYEFLTPQVMVLKCSKPNAVKNSSIEIIKHGSWRKENALLRDKNGNILYNAKT